MKTREPQAVKFFIGALFSDKESLNAAIQLCQDHLGTIDFNSDSFEFDQTSYYEMEMGAPLWRRFISFEMLRSPGELAALKIRTNEMEVLLADKGKRKVNLDIGYLDFHKVVLASAKYNGQKIYLDHGIYADTTLMFENGKFEGLKNTFPDFKGGRYDKALLEIRSRYKTQLK